MDNDQITQELEVYRKHIAALTQELAELYSDNNQNNSEAKELIEDGGMKGQVDELKNCIKELCGVLQNTQATQISPNLQFQAIPGMIVSPNLPFLKTPDIAPVMPARISNQNNGDPIR